MNIYLETSAQIIVCSRCQLITCRPVINCTYDLNYFLTPLFIPDYFIPLCGLIKITENTVMTHLNIFLLTCPHNYNSWDLYSPSMAQLTCSHLNISWNLTYSLPFEHLCFQILSTQYMSLSITFVINYQWRFEGL